MMREKTKVGSGSIKNHYSRHGMSGRPGYDIFIGMHARCHNPKNPYYKDYGARGITVCARWRSIAAFFEDMGEPPTSRHSLGRRDNDRGYSKANCYWALPLEQQNNRRDNVFIIFRGKRQTVSGWKRETGILNIGWRLKHGWSVERALTEV